MFSECWRRETRRRRSCGSTRNWNPRTSRPACNSRIVRWLASLCTTGYRFGRLREVSDAGGVHRGGGEKADADTDHGIRRTGRWLRRAIRPNAALKALSARRWPAIRVSRRRTARSQRRAQGTAASAGAAAIRGTTTASSASIGSSSARFCTARNRRPPTRWGWARTARRGGGFWPGCRARLPSGAPSTCGATASGTAHTTWSFLRHAVGREPGGAGTVRGEPLHRRPAAPVQP